MYFKRLKEKWEITSNFQLVVIFIVFAITGSLSVRLAKPILNFFQIDPIRFEDLFMGTFLYWILRILIIFPVYQILLILVGTVFFQYRFFWEFEKKILKRMGFKSFFKDV
ncbi:diacylglyceryl transferase [Flavobacteriaceae bacterium]|nr:diacylglyceryl transferase [Flavobacteriaceae bacterium]